MISQISCCLNDLVFIVFSEAFQWFGNKHNCLLVQQILARGKSSLEMPSNQKHRFLRRTMTLPHKFSRKPLDRYPMTTASVNDFLKLSRHNCSAPTSTSKLLTIISQENESDPVEEVGAQSIPTQCCKHRHLMAPRDMRTCSHVFSRMTSIWYLNLSNQSEHLRSSLRALSQDQHKPTTTTTQKEHTRLHSSLKHQDTPTHRKQINTNNTNRKQKDSNVTQSAIQHDSTKQKKTPNAKQLDAAQQTTHINTHTGIAQSSPRQSLHPQTSSTAAQHAHETLHHKITWGPGG